ncbi:MAG: iron-containing alcohol dehydrogenase [Desulfurococcaceae archaeon]
MIRIKGVRYMVWNKVFSFKFGEVSVHFGPGSLSENIPAAIHGSKKALIISSKSAAKVSGALNDVVKALREAGVEYLEYNNVTPNPSTNIVDEIVELGQSQGVDTIIGIGGGSVIDTSKAASVLIGTGIKARELVLGRKPSNRGLKLIAVNLTHGTGTEVDRFAVLTIQGTIEKRGFAIRYPDYSFDDPKYTTTLSKKQTLYTSLDAFYHAYESATAKRANLFVQSLAETSVSYIVKYLNKALDNPGDLEARTMLLYSSMLSGMCIDLTSGTHLIHAMEHGFSGLNPELPHGAGLAILGPFVIYYTHKAVPETSARLLKHLDPSIKPLSEDAEKAMRSVIEFQRSLGFHERLSDYGIKEKDLKPVLDFVEKTVIERFGANTPFQVTRSMLEEIARRAI